MHKTVKGITLALCALPLQVQAWGFAGHEYIGETAYYYLTEEAREWVDQHLERLDEESLATATTWADRVRGTDEGQWLGPLHFANIPPEENQIDMQRDCPNRRCVVGAAKDAVDIMFDPDADAMEQADALRKFTHWITDLHQPLHLGFARDRGGNDTQVIFDGEESNLHRVWDTQILNQMNMPSPEQLSHENPLSETQKDWGQALINWANEANHLARRYAYEDINDGDPISAEYVQRAAPVIEQQLLNSAQRMARIINDAAAQP
ncbi:hypothetical protein CWE09_00080 [Aliidiomarina minuta]|uniref:S1/P1 Nuclease n=1 Tax=Aliidiomarina minuta TaxID=880057 RepID=A0A432W565_9GAMM|nr:S1/P1 nuclease [Aliidiomarina minuta]RUO25181.1 hypothetical protein CWE09_00080 [Aliidiomarina minuta]